MKAILSGIAMAAIIAVGAALVLDGNVQRGVDMAYQTQGVRQ